jgi:hypothetical protein
MQKFLFISSFLLMTAAACGKDGGSAEGFINEYGALKTKVCACTDKACADKAKAAADAHERSAKEKKIPKPTKAQEERFEKIEDEISACARKFDAPEPPPAVPAATPTPP